MHGASFLSSFVSFNGNSSESELNAVADHEAILVPIRLDIDTDEYRLRDTFTWNVNGMDFEFQQFARDPYCFFVVSNALTFLYFLIFFRGFFRTTNDP